MRLVYENSDCHSLDRHDLGAQRDSCAFQDYRVADSAEGQETGAERAMLEWERAVDLQFNVTHWPYIQS